MADPAALDDDAEEGAEKAAPRGRKSKKLFVIIAIVVVVLGGGAFAAMKFMGGGKDDPKKKEAEKHEVLPARYITLDPPFVVNFEAESSVRFLQITIGIMTRDPETEELIKENDPRIRNDLLMLLGNQNYDSISTLEGKEKLRERALEAVRDVVKEIGRRSREGRGAVLHQLRDAVGRKHHGRTGSSQSGRNRRAAQRRRSGRRQHRVGAAARTKRATTISADEMRIVRGRMPTLEMVNERFARQLRVSLYNLLRRSLGDRRRAR